MWWCDLTTAAVCIFLYIYTHTNGKRTVVVTVDVVVIVVITHILSYYSTIIITYQLNRLICTNFEVLSCSFYGQSLAASLLDPPPRPKWSIIMNERRRHVTAVCMRV